MGNLKVLVNGTQVKRRRGRAAIYPIAMSDGTTVDLRLDGQWTGLKATVNGVQTALEPPVPKYLVALIFLPLGLAVLGGVIGGVVGAVAASVNLGISRAAMRPPLKLVAMLGATALGVAAWFTIAYAISPVPTLEIGQCSNGIRPGATLTADAYRSIPCESPHEAEVFGSVQYVGSGAFPGETALLDFGQAPCAAAFASYVGIDFQESSLQAIIVTPSEATWIKGDRAIVCVAFGPNGSTLTGSIRGTAR